MKRTVRLGTVVGWALLGWASPLASQGSDAGAYVASLKPNVARLEADGRSGFGFIVGIGQRELIVATAWHTLEGPEGSPPTRDPTVCFEEPHGCAQGELLYVADPIGSEPALDLAFVSAPHPERLEWRPDALGGSSSAGNPVWVIGRASEWYIPRSPGRVVASDPGSLVIQYERLEVAEGVSGAPVVGLRGIVGLHFESAGENSIASGIEIAAVRGRMGNVVGRTWILVPPAECTDHGAEARVLQGRSVAVRFDPNRISAGLEAMALLNCVGARALPRPVWDDEPTTDNLVTYGGGDLRAARALQSLLAPLGRLDTALRETEVGLEVAIRR